jgi:hypothetical protein
MRLEYLSIILGGIFFLVIAYVAWLKFREHLHAHRDTHDSRSHHVVSVRKIPPRHTEKRGQRTKSRSHRR